MFYFCLISLTFILCSYIYVDLIRCWVCEDPSPRLLVCWQMQCCHQLSFNCVLIVCNSLCNASTMKTTKNSSVYSDESLIKYRSNPRPGYLSKNIIRAMFQKSELLMLFGISVPSIHREPTMLTVVCGCTAVVSVSTLHPLSRYHLVHFTTQFFFSVRFIVIPWPQVYTRCWKWLLVVCKRQPQAHC